MQNSRLCASLAPFPTRIPFIFGRTRRIAERERKENERGREGERRPRKRRIVPKRRDAKTDRRSAAAAAAEADISSCDISRSLTCNYASISISPSLLGAHRAKVANGRAQLLEHLFLFLLCCFLGCLHWGLWLS